MLTDMAWQGVSSLLDDYANVQPEDTVIVAYTSDSRLYAAWVMVALQGRGISARQMWMGRLHDNGFVDRLSALLPGPDMDEGRLVIIALERSTMSHMQALREMLARYQPHQCVVIRAISACEELFATALRAKPSELSARNTALLEQLMPAESLRVETDAGTQLTISVDSDQYRWISNRGVWRPGSVVILPAGEVATYPASVDGVLVADYAFNLNTATELDTRLESYPVTVTVENGSAVDYRCEDPEVTKLLERFFAMPNAHQVGELGFGTNFQVGQAIAMNSHINERRPGVHLGFGQHNQHKSVVGYRCELHLDLIARGGRVWVDDNPVPLVLDDIAPSANPHPANFRDEDIDGSEDLDSDCCGTMSRAQCPLPQTERAPVQTRI